MHTTLWRKGRRQRGFSLIELMIVLLVLTIMMGAVFQQLALVQQRNAAEQAKTDIFQESRNFLDQLTRDLHQTGYPNPRNFAPNFISGPNDANAAVGLVKVTNNQLIFEGDVDGDGVVDSVQFFTATTGTGCPCLRRSQTIKLAGNPLTGQATAVYYTEVQGVQNSTSIFSAYDRNGTAITLPVNINANATTMAQIKTIKINLTVQASQFDPATRQFPIASLISTVNLDNCSQAANSQPMSCQQ